MGYQIVNGVVRPDVYGVVEAERERQVTAGRLPVEDDARDLAEFASEIAEVGEVIYTIAPISLAYYAELFARIAALAVAALESIERRPGGRA